MASVVILLAVYSAGSFNPSIIGNCNLEYFTFHRFTSTFNGCNMDKVFITVHCKEAKTPLTIVIYAGSFLVKLVKDASFF